MRTLFAALVLAGLVAACTDQAAAPTAAAPAVQASIAQNGTIHMPNSPVWRARYQSFARERVVTADHDWQLVYYDAPVVHPACNGGAWGGEPPWWEEMVVVAQNAPLDPDVDPIVGDVKVLLRGMAHDLPLVIYDNPTWDAMRALYGPLSPGFCTYLQTGWLYRGAIEMRRHDNSMTGEGEGMNTWGWLSFGPVYDQGGTRYRFAGRTHFQYEPPDLYRVLQYDFDVK